MKTIFNGTKNVKHVAIPVLYINAFISWLVTICNVHTNGQSKPEKLVIILEYVSFSIHLETVFYCSKKRKNYCF